jgi:preprotein translocase subunit SecY
MFLMWLGEQITERGIGNGISMIILAGIVAGLPAALGGTLELVRTGEMSLPWRSSSSWIVARHRLRGVRRARPATHHRSTTPSGRGVASLLAGQSTHLPFKLNMSGVIPPIFASSLLLFPATIASWFGTERGARLAAVHFRRLGRASPLHMVLYAP